MNERRDTSVPRKHNTDYRDRGNWVQIKPETYTEWSIALTQKVKLPNQLQEHTLLSFD